MISASNLNFSYGDSQVVDDVSLSSRTGQILGLIGPNGSGKTTLLRMLYGSLKPTDGDVQLNGRSLRSWSSQKIAQQIAVVVQHIEGETMLTTEEMVLLGRTPYHRSFSRTTKHDRQLASRALERVGATTLAARPFSALSGGERQRVLIARALAQEAEILLMDEPTNHLDVRYQHEILHLVRSLQATTVVVLHDLNLAAQYCDELILLDHGKVHAVGPPDEVLTVNNIETVYQIATRLHAVNGRLNLTFEPLHTASARLETNPEKVI